MKTPLGARKGPSPGGKERDHFSEGETVFHGETKWLGMIEMWKLPTLGLPSLGGFVK